MNLFQKLGLKEKEEVRFTENAKEVENLRPGEDGKYLVQSN